MYPINAGDLRRLELLVRAFDWHRREGDRALAEYLEDLHRDYAERAGLPEPVDAYGDTFVVEELSHAHDVLGELCVSTTCLVLGCNEAAPAHLGWCLQHNLEWALTMDEKEDS
jgi:hypothetical protein